MNSIAKYILLSLLCLWLFVKGVIPAWNTVYSDFSNYYVSSCLVIEGGSLERLYDNEWFQEQIKAHGINQPGKFSPFPPLSAWIMLPLTFTDALSAMRIWVIINLALLGICIWLIQKLTSWNLTDAALLVLAAGNGLVNNINFGQVYLLIMAGMLYLIWLSESNRNTTAGWLLGTLAWLKYIPITLIIGFFMLKNYRIILFTILAAGTLLIAQFIFFGSSVMSDFFYASLLPHLNGDLAGQEMYSYLFQSWDNLFRHIFVYSAAQNPNPVMDWPSGRTVGKLVVYATVSVSLIFALRKIIALRLAETTKQGLLLALPMLAAFVILPATASYHFVLLIIPLMLFLRSNFFRQAEKTGILIIFSAIGFIPYRFFYSLADTVGLLLAYPRLGLVSFLYTGALLVIFRRRSDIHGIHEG